MSQCIYLTSQLLFLHALQKISLWLLKHDWFKHHFYSCHLQRILKMPAMALLANCHLSSQTDMQYVSLWCRDWCHSPIPPPSPPPSPHCLRINHLLWSKFNLMQCMLKTVCQRRPGQILRIVLGSDQWIYSYMVLVL